MPPGADGMDHRGWAMAPEVRVGARWKPAHLKKARRAKALVFSQGNRGGLKRPRALPMGARLSQLLVTAARACLRSEGFDPVAPPGSRWPAAPTRMRPRTGATNQPLQRTDSEARKADPAEAGPDSLGRFRGKSEPVRVEGMLQNKALERWSVPMKL